MVVFGGNTWNPTSVYVEFVFCTASAWILVAAFGIAVFATGWRMVRRAALRLAADSPPLRVSVASKELRGSGGEGGSSYWVSFMEQTSGLERKVKVAKSVWAQLTVGDSIAIHEKRGRRQEAQYVHASRPIDAATMLPQLIVSLGMMLSLSGFALAILGYARGQLFCP